MFVVLYFCTRFCAMFIFVLFPGYFVPSPCVLVSLFSNFFPFCDPFFVILPFYFLANSLVCWLAYVLPSYSLPLALRGQITVRYFQCWTVANDHCFAAHRSQPTPKLLFPLMFHLSQCHPLDSPPTVTLTAVWSSFRHRSKCRPWAMSDTTSHGDMKKP